MMCGRGVAAWGRPIIGATMTNRPSHFNHLTPLGDALPFVGRMRDIIERIRLFDDLDAGEVEILARHMVCYRAPAMTEIINEGAPGDFMLLILEGAVEITKLNRQGFPARIGAVGPGKTLGEMSLIDGKPRFASCVTIEDTLFAVLDRDKLTRIVANEPGTGAKLLIELLMLLNQRLRLVSSDLIGLLEDARN